MRLNRKIVLNIILFQLLLVVYMILDLKSANFNQPFVAKQDDIIDFEGFDNVNGVDSQIVPNIVHLLYLKQPYIRFYQLVNILSIYYNHQPDCIYIHCDECGFTGKYFNILRKQTNVWNIIKIFRIPFKSSIFGVQYK